MKTLFLFCFCILLFCGSATAELNGSDDFNDNSRDTDKWLDIDPLLTETNNRVEFSNTGTGVERGSWYWIQNTGSYTQDWTVSIDAYNSSTPSGAPSTNFITLTARNSHNPSDSFSIGLAVDGIEGRQIWGGWNDYSGSMQFVKEPISFQAAELKIFYDKTTETLSCGYNTGDGFIALTNFNPSSWSTGTNDAFLVGIACYALDSAVSSGEVYADNFVAITAGDPPPYAFSVDRFQVIGNLPGTVVEEFDNDILFPWRVDNGTATEHDGVVTLSNPGDVGLQKTGNFIVTQSFSEIDTMTGSTGLEVADGEGDFTATSTWAATLPAENRRYFMYADTQTVEGADLTRISLGIFNIGPLLGDYFGIADGTYIILNDEITHDRSAVQAFPVSEDDVSGDILFSLSFDDISNQFTGSFSLNGGMTFQSPFTPIDSGMGTGVFTDWGLHAESWDVRYFMEPSIFHSIACSNQTVYLSISNLTVNASNVLERSFDLMDSNGWYTVTSFISVAPQTNINDVVSNSWQRAHYRIQSQ